MAMLARSGGLSGCQVLPTQPDKEFRYVGRPRVQIQRCEQSDKGLTRRYRKQSKKKSRQHQDSPFRGRGTFGADVQRHINSPLPSGPSGPADGVSSPRSDSLRRPDSKVSLDAALFLAPFSGWPEPAACGSGPSEDAVLWLALRSSMVERGETAEVAPEEEEARRSWGGPSSVILGER